MAESHSQVASSAPSEGGAEQATPSVPAGEPEGPVSQAAPTAQPDGPSRPHGDELSEATSDQNGAEERGADQDPDAPAAQNVEQDLAALSAKAGKADEYLQLAQRTQADFENYRKRAIRDAAAAQDRGVAKLAKELLPAVDNLDRALQAAEAASKSNGDATGDDTLASGIKLVHADVIAALGRCGIESFSPEGEQFDPQHHEAIAQMPVEGAQSGTVVEVYQRGYRLGENVLRPARVVVAA
jgi:molecular chaperone GrpE